MNLVHLSSSAEAISKIEPELKGKIIRFANIFSRQNIRYEPIEFFGIKSSIRKRTFEPDCEQCLTRSGYQMHGLNTFIQDGPKLFLPQNLENCKKAITVPSVVDVETDDGAKISFAILEGCRVGFAPKLVVLPDEAFPTVYADPKLIPAVADIYFSGLDFGFGPIKSIAEVWTKLKSAELRVSSVALSETSYHDPAGLNIPNIELKFNFMLEHGELPETGELRNHPLSVRILLGNAFAEHVDPIMWVDLKKGADETRFLVDSQFKALLFE